MTCTERKVRLSGEAVSYACDLLALEADYGVLRYVVSERRTIASATLLPGTVTLAVYWPERNYNLYYWAMPAGLPPADADRKPPAALRPIGYYFNIVDSVSLTPACFTYRDLVVDVFVAPGGEPVVLDEEELPADTEPSLLAFIEAIKRELLRDHKRIIEEADRLLAPLLEAA